MSTAVRFTCDRRELAAGLTWAVKGIGLRPALPILAGMRVDVSAGTVTLAAFDYDLCARSVVTATGTGAGSVLVRGHQLLTAVKAMKGGKGAQVTAAVNGNGLMVTCGGASATAEILPDEDYPELPAMPPSAGVATSADFAAAVARVVPSAGTDQTLPALTAVRFTFRPASVRLAATDRYRLAEDEIPFTTAGEDWSDLGMSVPARALSDYAAKLGRDGKVTIHLGDTKASAPFAAFSDGTRDMIVRCETGEFPRYRALFPGQIAASASADAAGMVAALKRAALASERNGPVHLRFTRDSVTVTAHRDGIVSSSETLPCELDAPQGEGYAVTGWRGAYNPAYLASILAGVDGTARLAWGDRNKPVLVKADGAAGGYRAMVMPVRVAV